MFELNQSFIGWPPPQPPHRQIQVTSAIYTTACGDAGSLTQLSEARDQTQDLMDISWALNPLSH